MILDVHGAGRRLVQSGDDPEQGALAASTRTQEGDELMLSEIEVDLVEGSDRPGLGDEGSAHPRNPDRGGGPGLAQSPGNEGIAWHR
jgi:hypothetical protein